MLVTAGIFLNIASLGGRLIQHHYTSKTEPLVIVVINGVHFIIKSTHDASLQERNGSSL